MAGTPAQNGNSAAGSSDFSRKAEELARNLWTTPQAHDVRQRGAGQTSGATLTNAGNRCLATDAAQWPTPVAQNVNGSSPGSVTRADGKSRMDILHYRAEQGFSRPDQETPTHGLPSSDPRQTWRHLRRLVISTHGRAAWKRMAASGGKRRLNPVFVEWLQGWPRGHSLCGFWAMPLSRCKPRWHGLHSRQHMDWGGLNGEMSTLREVVRAEQALKQGGEDQAEVLREPVCTDVKKACDHDVRLVWRNIHSNEKGGKVLQPKMQCLCSEKGCAAPLPKQEDQWEGLSGTPMGDATALGAGATNDGACAPQERDQDRQPSRQFDDRVAGRTRAIAYVAGDDDAMRGLRNSFHADQDEAGDYQNLLDEMSLRTDVENPAFAAFLKWQRDMRGALSQLPMASGAWIWKPPVESETPEQMSLW